MAVDFNTPLPSGIALLGSAVVASSGGVTNSGVLKLTRASEGQKGAIVIGDFSSGAIVSGFTVEFDVRLGGGSNPPGDGFSVNFTPPVGDPNAGSAEDGVGVGLSVNFDIYDNPSDNGGAPGIDIRYKGEAQASKKVALATLETAASFGHVKIELKADHTLSVVYKGLVIHDNVPIKNFAPVAGNVFLLAARTGLFYENCWIDNLQVSTLPESTAYTIALQASPAVGGTVGGAGVFNEGTSQTVTATKNDGYRFLNWTEGGAVVGESTSSSALNISAPGTFFVGGMQPLDIWFKGNLFEIQIYREPLPEAEAGQVRQSLAVKYGASRSAPSVWLKADSGVSTDPDGLVASWDSAAQTPFKVSQNDPARRPMLVVDSGSGQPALRFDGNDSLLVDTQARALAGSSSVSIFMVQRRLPENTRSLTLAWWDPANGLNNRIFAHLPYDGVNYFDFGGTPEGRLSVPDNGASAGKVQVIELTRFSNGLQRMVLDGAIVGESKMSSAFNTSAPGTFFVGGMQPLDIWFKGDIFEVQIYREPLPEAEAGLVRRSLAMKYGASTRMPSVWLKADTGISTDADGLVASWGSAAQTPFKVSQNDPVRRPKLVVDAGSGQPALRFDGNDSLLTDTVAGALAGSSTVSIFMVQRRLPENTRSLTLAWWDPANGLHNRIFAHFPYDGVNYFDFGGTPEGRLSVPDNGASAGKLRVIELTRFSNGFQKMVIDGAVVSSDPGYTFTLDGDKTLVANFVPETYTVMVSAAPAEGGSASGAGTFGSGTSRIVTATRSAGYDFLNWTEGATVVSSDPNYTFTLNEKKVLVANFARTKYTIALQSGNPLVGRAWFQGVDQNQGSGSFEAGSSVTVLGEATRPDYRFVNWTEDSVVVSTSGAYTFTVDRKRNLVANFENPFLHQPVPVNVSASPPEGGSVAGGGSFDALSAHTVTAAPIAGFKFDNWSMVSLSGESTVVSTLPSYNFTVPPQSGGTYLTLVAHFTRAAQTTHTISVAAAPAAGGTVTGGGTFNEGSNQTVIANPNTGYRFLNWTEAGTVVSDSANYSFALQASRTLSANFVPASDGLVAWWRAEQDAEDFIGSNMGSLVNSAGFAPGILGQAFSFNPSTQDYVSIPHSQAFDLPTQGSIVLWHKLKSNQPQYPALITRGENADAKNNFEIYILAQQKMYQFSLGDGVSTLAISDVPVPLDDQWHQVAFTWSATSVNAYVDGNLKSSKPQSLTPASVGKPPILFGAATPGDSRGTPNGLIDEVRIYSKALASSEIQSLFALQVSTPAISGVSPNSGLNTGGALITLTGSGFAPGSTVRFGSRTSPSVTFSSASSLVVTTPSAPLGLVDILVMAPDGGVGNLAGGFTFLGQPPMISAQPQSLLAALGANARFSVELVDPEGIAYQWLFNGSPIAGATSASLEIKNIQPANVGFYGVTLSNPFGSSSTVLASLALSTATGTLPVWGLQLTRSFARANPGDTVAFRGVIQNNTAKPLRVRNIGVYFDLAPESGEWQSEFSKELLEAKMIIPVGGFAGPLFSLKLNTTLPSGFVGSGSLSVMLEPSQDFGEIAPSESSPISLLAGFVVNEPELGIQRSADGVELLWPSLMNGFILEESSQLGRGALWEAVPAQAAQEGSQMSVTFPAGSASKYYRLVRP